MTHYDYRAGKKRIDEILDARMPIETSSELPSTDNLTFENAYHSWISALFVDIRNSTELFADDDREQTAKIVRSFTSEIIEILRDDPLRREIGIRGDCVYAIYTTPDKDDIFDVHHKAAYINTFIAMLNKILRNHGLNTIRAGIGLAAGHDHIIKAGRKGVGINSTVWIGDAVAKASKLSGYGDKNGISRIVMNSVFYSNLADVYEKKYPEKGFGSWYDTSGALPYSGSRHGSVIMSDMNNWVNNGMVD